MKTAKHVFEKVISIENLRKAVFSAAKDKADRSDVQRVLGDVDNHVLAIRDMLIDKSFTPCKCREFKIREGTGQKERLVVKINFFPDQIIHWAIILQLQPLIERGAYEYSCGSMPGKGIHFGKRKLESWIRGDRKNTKYVAKLDITKYYASISHTLAKGAVRKLTKDPNLLWLLDLIVESYDNGLPIGFLLSQWLANYTLQPIDHFIKQVCRVKYYIRYMDDMVLLGRNKKELHKAVRMVMDKLHSFRLEIKGNWQVFKLNSRALDFMGFRFFGNKTILRKSLMLRISRKAHRISKRGRATFTQASAMLSYMGWVKHSDSHNFYKQRICGVLCIAELKDIVRRYSRREIDKNESILFRKHREAKVA